MKALRNTFQCLSPERVNFVDLKDEPLPCSLEEETKGALRVGNESFLCRIRKECKRLEI